MQHLKTYIKLGERDKNWYQECEQVFVEIFGRENLWLVTRMFAATSINTSLRSNITLFRKALYEYVNRLPVGNYLPNIKSQLIKIRKGEDVTGLKINSFARAMSGDRNAVVVDLWLSRAFEFKNDRVSKKEYELAEFWCREYAELNNLEPRQVSAMIWCGIRTLQTGDKQTHYKEQLRFHFQNLFNVI